ncbi:MAG: hypothetical protein FWF75_06120 [Propionibacteriaceae bacterium]|nr:hypothetical protein [Propionibacteriaceae bacterium]
MTPSPGARPSRRIRVLAAVVAVCAVAVLASGCGTRPSDSAFTGPTVFLPVLSPSPASSPTGPDYQTDVPTASPKLYQQALDVYNIFFAQNSAVQQDGGAEQLPPQLTAVLSGSALTKITQIAKSAEQHGFHWDGTPSFEMVKVAQLFTDVPRGTAIALQACEVTAGARLLDNTGAQLLDGSPVMVMYRYFMRYNNQHNLVIVDLTGGTERLSTCPIH